MSSAKSSQHALMNRGKLLMQMEKSNGPRTEPWGTPYLRDRASEADACTVRFLSVRNDTSTVSPETIHTLPIFEGGDHSLLQQRL